MARFYAVELTTTAIVQVKDDETEFDAAKAAQYNRRDILNDCPDMDVNVVGEVTRQTQLSLYGWDGMCIPYGGDGNTRLEDLLPNTESAASLPMDGEMDRKQEGGE